MHKVGSFFASASGAKPKAVGKELVDLSYKVNEETELEEVIKPYVSMQRDSKTNKILGKKREIKLPPIILINHS